MSEKEGPITKAAREFIYKGAEELDPKGYPARITELEAALARKDKALEAADEILADIFELSNGVDLALASGWELKEVEDARALIRKAKGEPK